MATTFAEFQEGYAAKAPYGKKVKDVRGKGSDTQLLNSFKESLQQVSQHTATVASSDKDTRNTFIALDKNFSTYFDTVDGLDKLLQKMNDPNSAKTDEDTKRLRQLLDQEKRVLDSINKRSKESAQFNRAMVEAQEKTNFHLRERSYKDEEIDKATRLWQRSTESLWETIEGGMSNFSRGFMSNTGSGIISAFLGPQIGYLAHTVFQRLPEWVSTVKGMPAKYRALKASYGNAKDKVSAVKDVIQTRGLQAGIKSLLSGKVSSDELADDLLVAQEQLRQAMEDVPEELKPAIAELKDAIDNVVESGDRSTEVLEDLRLKALNLDKLADDTATVGSILETANFPSSVESIVPTPMRADVSTSDVYDNEVPLDFTRAYTTLEDIRDASLEMMVYLDSLDRKAEKMLSVTSSGDSVTDIVSSGETIDISTETLVAYEEIIELLRNSTAAQKDVWKLEAEDRETWGRFRDELMFLLRNGIGSEAKNKDGGGIGDLLGGLVGGGVAGGFMKKGLGKLVGKGAGKLAAKGAGKKLLGKFGAKGIGKTVAKMGGKSLAKKLPLGLGLLAGAGFAIPRLMKGDLAGAGAEVASGAASIIPGIGTGASLAIDAGLAARDIKNEMGAEGAAAPDTNVTVNSESLNEAQPPILPENTESEITNTTDDPIPVQVIEATNDVGNMPMYSAPADTTSVRNTPSSNQQEMDNAVRSETERASQPQAAPTAPAKADTSKNKPMKVSAAPTAPAKAASDIPVQVDDMGLLLVSSTRM